MTSERNQGEMIRNAAGAWVALCRIASDAGKIGSRSDIAFFCSELSV